MKKTTLNLLLLFSISFIFAQKKTEIITSKEFTKNQLKYAKILGVMPDQLTNTKLYDFIDKWIGTSYLIEKEGGGCGDFTSFSQRLFVASYNHYIERTAQKQYDSENTELYKNKKYLQEGDLIFFGKDPFNISHSGVYLYNNKFIHYTANTREGPSGVKISDLTTPFWSNLYISAGRRKFLKKNKL